MKKYLGLISFLVLGIPLFFYESVSPGVYTDNFAQVLFNISAHGLAIYGGISLALDFIGKE